MFQQDSALTHKDRDTVWFLKQVTPQFVSPGMRDLQAWSAVTYQTTSAQVSCASAHAPMSSDKSGLTKYTHPGSSNPDINPVDYIICGIAQ